jgi:hypothetical protein
MTNIASTWRGVLGALAILAGVVASSASADVNPAKAGLGQEAAKPEQVARLSDTVTVRIRLINEKSGNLASTVGPGELVAVKADVLGTNSDNEPNLSLVCTVRFLDMAGMASASPVDGRPCFEGRTYGGFQPLDMSLRFRGSDADPNGTYGVAFTVTDNLSGRGLVLVPTFGWTGGK